MLNKTALSLIFAGSVFTSAIAQETTQNAKLLPVQNQDAPQQIGAPVTVPEVLPTDASVGNAPDKIKEIAHDGAEGLKKLVGESVNNDREKSDVEARSQDLREINALEQQVKKAQLARDLYKLVNADDDKMKSELEAVKTERDAQAEHIKQLEEQLLQVNKQVQSQAAAQVNVANPVIVNIMGISGKLRAKILVPGFGETLVNTGDVLSSGERVTSITAKGVTISREGKPVKLNFGTSVPLTANIASR